MQSLGVAAADSPECSASSVGNSGSECFATGVGNQNNSTKHVKRRFSETSNLSTLPDKSLLTSCLVKSATLPKVLGKSVRIVEKQPASAENVRKFGVSFASNDNDSGKFNSL